MRYLLDTNIVSNLVRNPRGRVADRIKAIGEQNICTSIIVAAELRYGTTKKASPRLSTQVEAVLGAMDTLPFDSPADEFYGSIRTRLESAGTPIGGNDLLGHRGNEWVKVDHFPLKSVAAWRSAPSVEGIPRPAAHRLDAA